MSESEKIKNNLKGIRSEYIVSEVFSFLNEKRKLNMIFYNKKLQNLLKADIKDYKKMFGTYKIEDENGKERVYLLQTNRLIFVGEYLYGERNGKGEEYDIKGLKKWAGHYSNGERNGKGEEYYSDGRKKFKGEYLNGKRHGKGEEYYHYGQLKFKGEYLNGKIWNGEGYNLNRNIEFKISNGKGYIKEYYKDATLKFEGEYLDGIRNGEGKEYSKYGELIFKGQYQNGEKN